MLFSNKQMDKNKKQVFIKSEDLFKWVINVAKLTKKFWKKTNKTLKICFTLLFKKEMQWMI